MIDLGKKREIPDMDSGEDMPVPSTEGNSKRKMKTIIDYPNLHLESDELPGVEDVGFGKMVKLTFIAKVTGVRKQDYNGGKICIDFDLMKGEMVAAPQEKVDMVKSNKATDEDIADMGKPAKALDMGEPGEYNE